MGLTQRWHRIYDGSSVVSGDNSPWGLAGSWFHTPARPTPPSSRSLVRLRGESGNLAMPLEGPGRGQALRKEGEVPESTFLSAKTWRSPCTHITLQKVVSVLVFLGPAHSYFSKAPAVDKAGLGTRGDAAFFLRVPQGEAT